MTESIDTCTLQSFWEPAHATRWGAYITEVERGFIQQADQLAGPPSGALEVGSGGGRWSMMLTDLGWKMTCTDSNPDSLAICQQRIPSAQCIHVQADSQELPCATRSVRLLLCIEVPMVIGTDWFIEEAFRCLQPGGVVVGVFVNGRSLRGLMKRWFGKRTDCSEYYQVAYSHWRTKFVHQGFKMVNEEGICWFPYGRQSNSPLIPASVSLERHLGLRRLTSISPWIVFIAQKRPEQD